MPSRAAEELPHQQLGFNWPQEPSPSPSVMSALRVCTSSSGARPVVLLRPEVVAQQGVPVLTRPIGEVLAGDADAGVLSSLQLPLVDKTSHLHADLALFSSTTSGCAKRSRGRALKVFDLRGESCSG